MERHQLRIHPAMRPFLGHCFYKVALKMRFVMDEKLEPYGLIAPQFGIMSLLSQIGSLTQNELGNYMAIDKATMVRFLDGLEQKKFLIRTTDPQDRRAKVLQLTSLGKKILDGLSKIRPQVEQEIFSPLSKPELEVLRELVAKIAIRQE